MLSLACVLSSDANSAEQTESRLGPIPGRVTVADVLTCHYKTSKSECTAPATHHILVDDEHVSRACDDHLQRAIDQLSPMDHHPHGEICWLSTSWEPRLRWQMSTSEARGFCYLDDDIGMLLEQSELVSVGSSPDSGSA